MSEFDLERKFPNLRKLASRPPNGSDGTFGLVYRGARDRDTETGAFVTTAVFCVLFIPIYCYRAFRVVDASDGRYFLGQEPLSMMAKLWNLIVMTAIAGGIGAGGWSYYTSRPDYIASQSIANGDQLVADGDIHAAAVHFHDVAMGESGRSFEAEEKLRQIVDGPAIESASPDDTVEVLKMAVDLQQRDVWAADKQSLISRAIAIAAAKPKTEPQDSLKILDTVLPIAKDDEALAEARFKILEALVAKQPDDVKLVSQLAVLYERKEMGEKCETLLMPHAEKLGDTEGARILGQILARRGDVEKSFSLLNPYCQRRLKKLHDAEKRFTNVFTDAQQKVMDSLNNDEAPDSFYRNYKAAGEAERIALVDNYVTEKLKDDFRLKQAQNGIRDAARVVPVALDLGMVRLRRAQDHKDQTQRNAELKAAEETFLAIRSVAGETDQYRMYLGQVYYWLGKQQEGHKLFDDLLVSNARNPEMLIMVSHLLREVGEVVEARKLMEESYGKATKLNDKHSAAMQRSVAAKDLDDRILWLRRANQESSDVKTSLHAALGQKALSEGKDDEAAKHLRDAVRGYSEMPESAASLNNGALACFSLYRVTGERSAMEKANAMMKQAVALQPADSILLFNAASYALESALRDIIGDQIDLQKIRAVDVDFDLLEFLIVDAESRTQWMERVRNHKSMEMCVNYLNRVLILAPKTSRPYNMLSSVHGFTNDESALRDLLKRIDEGQPDPTESIEAVLKSNAGEDKELIPRIEASIAKLEKVIGLIPADKRDATFAIAACRVSQFKMMRTMFDLDVDVDEIVDLAGQAHRAAPSLGTNTVLRSALIFRAGKHFGSQNPAYQSLATRAGRSLRLGYLIPIAMHHSSDLQEAMVSNADIQRAMELMNEQQPIHPQRFGPYRWAVLAGAKSDQTEAQAAGVKADEVNRLLRQISLRLSPANATAGVDEYWAKVIEGKKSEGLEILRQVGSHGVTIPIDGD